MHKVLIGVLTYNDLHFLMETLPVVDELRKTLPADVVVMDTAWNDEIRDWLKENYPDFKYSRHEDGNIGYGLSYDTILDENPGHKYFLVYTSDVILKPDVVKQFVKRMERDREIAMCAGKLYHWDFVNDRKTMIIDSFGIEAQKRHHFYDRGHGEVDDGQYDDSLGEIFGISGAVFMIRTSVVTQMGRLFDERMWMYKEDIDLSYRLRWMGEKIMMFPEVWGWHARTVANKEGHGMFDLSKSDKEKRGYARAHSYRNHLLLLKNNFTWRYGLFVILRMLLFEFFKGLYMFVCHPFVFFSGMKTLFFVKGSRNARLVSSKDMLKFFR